MEGFFLTAHMESEKPTQVFRRFSETVYSVLDTCFINTFSLCVWMYALQWNNTSFLSVKLFFMSAKAIKLILMSQLCVLWMFSAFISSVHFKGHVINIALDCVPTSVWQ